MPARGRVHGDGVVAGFQRNAAQMRQALLLGFFDIAQQRGGGGDGQRAILDAKCGEVMHTKKLQQLAAAGIGIEQPRCTSAQATCFQRAGRPTVFIGKQGFHRLQAGEFRFQRVVTRHFVRTQATAGQIRPRQPVAMLPACNRQQQRVAAFVQQCFVRHGAGRDDTHHFAFDQTFAECRVADLLANGHRFAQRHQARQIAFGGVIGHAGHRDRLPRGCAALGQGDVQQPCCLARIVIKQLVEIAHPEKQQHLRMLRLGGEELLH